ncbi:CASP-like protein [Rhynchospora pubera]|uniref:CASP-like protein n=1 Tax=Rhynchospora pubera TaxID=906938 RepID=A0AAV8DCB2_9POAL|nr:CASP-like protein [Rhynchospora pubera]
MSKALRSIFIFVRVGIAAACAVAAIIMATSHYSTNFFGITMEAKFQYTPSFKFFVITNAIASAYNLVVVFVPTGSPLSGLVIMCDTIMAMLLTGAMAATGAISELGKHGNAHAGWLPICNQIQAYCDHVSGSLISAFVGLIVFVLFMLYNIFKIVSLDLHACR